MPRRIAGKGRRRPERACQRGLLDEWGAPREIILFWYEGAFELVVSYELLFELQSVLLRKKFRRYRPERDMLDYVPWLRENAMLESKGEVQPLSRDPEDDYLLALARNSGADYLVSGDSDLRDLEGEDLPAVVSPLRFADIVPAASTVSRLPKRIDAPTPEGAGPFPLRRGGVPPDGRDHAIYRLTSLGAAGMRQPGINPARRNGRIVSWRFA